MENSLQDKFKREEFCEELEQPLEGHFERFEKRLLKKEESSSIFRWNFKNFGLMAACAAGLVFMALFLMQPNVNPIAETENTTTSNIALREYSIEAGLKEAFYTSKMEEISLDPDLRDDVQLKELFLVIDRLDKEYLELNTKLKVNFQNEHLINAILENYRLKLELMEKIQKIIQVKHRIKNTNHGKEIS